MRTSIFAYKGIIGILSSPEAEGLIAKPGNGNLGCVLDASKIDISIEALELLKTIRRGRGGLGEIDIFKAGDTKVIFGWLGGYMKLFKPSEIETSRDYDPSLLVSSEDVIIPEDFKKVVESITV